MYGSRISRSKSKLNRGDANKETSFKRMKKSRITRSKKGVAKEVTKLAHVKGVQRSALPFVKCR